jgi:hypothetical protein
VIRQIEQRIDELPDTADASAPAANAPLEKAAMN